MVEIVINYDKEKDEFKVYEPTTDTILISKSLSEALLNLSNFLSSSGLIDGDILSYPDISYHLDSYTVKQMIESNVNLLKRLNTAPSGFMISSQRFGGSSISSSKDNSNNSTFGKKKFGGMSSGFSGKSGFKKSNKKFGNQDNL